MHRLSIVPLLLTGVAAAQPQLSLDSLPVVERTEQLNANADWLLERGTFRARIGRRDDQTLVMDNGLVRRAWRIAPGCACVEFDNLTTGESILRSVRPEAVLTVNGVTHEVGGLEGQPNHAFLTPEWLKSMTPPKDAMRLVGYEVGVPGERFAWKRVRHHAPDAQWPPKGVTLRLDFEPAPVDDSLLESMLEGDGTPQPSDVGRQQLFASSFESLDGWTVHASQANERSSFENEGKIGEIYTPANTAVYAEHPLPPETGCVEATFDMGTDRSASWGPGLGLVFAGRVVKLNLRPGGNSYDSAAMLGAFDGKQENPAFGGRMKLDRSKTWSLRMRLADDKILCDLRPSDGLWRHVGSLNAKGLGELKALRVGKLDIAGGNTDAGTPGELTRCRVLSAAAYGALDTDALAKARQQLEASRRFAVSVFYELYDGIPAMAKWITVRNLGESPLTVDRMTTEILAVVEHANWVEKREGVDIPEPQSLHVETDFSFGGFHHANANRHVVHWRSDPLFTTQVNYLRQTPCLLVVEPTYGPSLDVAPGESLESYRTFELAHDSSDRERRGLAQRRLYRTVSPWATENPLMMHMRDADPTKVRAAIDQCSEVGFEMLILSFGSGFNMENDNPAYLAKWKEIADYAKSKKVEIGSYSLLSSRRIGGGNDVVSPEGQRPTHGNCPALTSEWGQRYFEKLYAFFPKTGFTLLEHDGPYPGDVDVTPRPPLQKGVDDSRWVQWKITSDFYRWCREQGIYVNAPDFYFHNGTSKCGMGYREVNWSLPRAHQVIHTRQNIYDGTWTKAPSMGWMFVPLSQYHGGGAAATIEPLDQHRDHYDRMVCSNLALGVQACYRGPRLFDTERVRDQLKSRVDWFKRYRQILEADVVHGRRADGRDIDWMLHVDPGADIPGMLVVFNPLEVDVKRSIRANLYYTGIRGSVDVRHEDQATTVVPVRGDATARIEVNVPAGGFTWYVLRPN